MLSLGIVRIVGTYYSTCLRPLQPSAPVRLSASMKLKIDLVVPGGMESMWRRVCPDADYELCKTWVSVAEEKGKGLEVVRLVSMRALSAISPDVRLHVWRDSPTVSLLAPALPRTDQSLPHCGRTPTAAR